MAEDGANSDEVGKSPWLLGLIAVGLGAGALVRYPHLTATSGLGLTVFFAAAMLFIGMPLLIAEGALGQFRRQNIADAMGPGVWRFGGFVLMTGAVLTAVLLAMIAGWAGRYVIDSFWSGFGDDPDRHFRLISSGFDAVLGALIAIGIAAGSLMLFTRRTLYRSIGTIAFIVIIVLILLAAWATLQSGATAGRKEFLTLDLDSLSGAMVLQGALLALLPTLIGLGAVATMSTRAHDRNLPTEASIVVVVLAAIPAVVGLFLVSLASANGHALSYDGSIGSLFAGIPRLLAELPAVEGGAISGLFFGSIFAAAISALIILMAVPIKFVKEAIPDFTPRRAQLAVGLGIYILAVPFAFGSDSVYSLHLFLAGILAPLAGIITAVHVGWIRPEVLNDYQFGDAEHKLAPLLRPYLQFVAPPVLALLLLVGILVWLVDIGAVTHGSGGLWSIVP